MNKRGKNLYDLLQKDPIKLNPGSLKMLEDLKGELGHLFMSASKINSTPELRKAASNYFTNELAKKGEVEIPITSNTSIRIYSKDNETGIEIKTKI